MTLDDLINELGQFGQDISDLSPVLQELGDEITREMRSKVPVDTGALRNSIRAQVTYNSLEIDMLYYGAFQNYGVNGTQDGIADKVQFGIQPRPTSEPFYAFKKRRWGLRPRRFFNMDLLEQLVVETLTETDI